MSQRLDHVTVGSIVIRCYEYDRMRAFWQAALHYEVEHADPNGGFVILKDPLGRGSNVSLDQAPVRRSGKRSWLHLDLYTTNQASEVERLVELGAKHYPWRYPPGADYVVLEDPDGNLFCVVQVREDRLTEPRRTWSERDFDQLSWHDNYVHGMSLVEREHGAGELRLDIDYIVEWVRGGATGTAFRIAPATLTFREVTNLRIALDYEAASASMGPFSLDRIERTTEQRERYEATLWTLVVNWPAGAISFEAAGFEQVLRGAPVVADQQVLTDAQRRDSAGDI